MMAEERRMGLMRVVESKLRDESGDTVGGEREFEFL